ncbi:MAG: EamA family transporter RarD [Myxococcales bacterium]
MGEGGQRDAAARRRTGIVYSLGAYTCWGLMPLYLRLVNSVPPLEFLMHRMIWSLVVVVVILAVRRQWTWLGEVLRAPRVLGAFAFSAAVLSVNWFLFVWAVHARRIVDASLGYFINPLITVALGALFLNERLRRAQAVAVALAAGGVLWLIVQVGQVPWLGLGLAFSFGLYGLLRKTAALGALEGLALETLLLSPVALVTLGWLAAHGENRFLTAPALTRVGVLMAGPMTTVPLLLFAAGARRIPLSLVGLLQYLGPTLQLLLGVLVMHEPFDAGKLAGYAFIWAGFLLASMDGLRQGAAAAPNRR